MLSDEEFNALHDLYNSTNGGGWLWHHFDDTVPWNFSIPKVNPCADKWQGLSCSCTDKHCDITYIYLSHHNMTGHLPLTIGSFPSVLNISFHFNNISGTLPTTIGNLTKLEGLDLSVNNLFGEIPKQIEYLQNLIYLDLSENAFNKIPDEFFTLTKLRELSLAANSIPGSISASFGNFRNLEMLQLEGNYFSQNLPDIFDNFPDMQLLNIEKNYLVGTLPPSFYTMYKLTSLTISYTAISSTISPAIGNFTNLQQLYLSLNRFYGRLPDTFGKLMNLRDCEINDNLFTGPLPSSLANLKETHFLYVEDNSFTGNVNFLTQLTKVNVIELNNNFFTGEFIVQPVQLLHIRYLQQSYNSFSGPMPWNTNWTALGNYEIYDNYYSGVLPHGNTTVSEIREYQDCANLIYLFADQNYLTGTIPEYFYLSCPIVFYFTFADNYLTGTVSQNISGLRSLNEWNVSLNYLTGSIPAEIENLANVAVMDFGYNQFTGKVPSGVQGMQLLEEFFIQNNQLSGSLDGFLGGAEYVRKSNLAKLRNLNLFGNKFTGTLPYSFFANATSLQSFVSGSNCLSGSIPEIICSVHFLITLSLDGLSTNCRVPLFTAVSPLFDGFTVRHFLQGTIPPCLYEMPSLQLLHLSGNGITGSIPSNITIRDTLTDLSLSHNLLTGTIPNNIQTKYWENLDLSYNKLTGTLSSQFAGVFDPSGNQELYLEINRLSGNIPSSFRNITNLAVLNGNIFSCSFNGGNLPEHDSDYADYSCGSDNVNYVLYAWIWALFFFPFFFLIFFKFLTKSLTVTSREEDDDEIAIGGGRSTVGARVTAGRSTVGTRVDNGRSTRSSTLQVVTKLTGIQYLKNVYDQILIWKQELRQDLSPETLNLVRLSLFLGELRQSIFIVTSYCMCVLLPLYCILKKFESSYSIEYAWYVAGVLLSGETAAVLLYFAFFGFLLLIYYLLSERLMKTINDKAPKFNASESKILIHDILKADSGMNKQMNKDFDYMERTTSVNTTDSATGVRKTTKDAFIVSLIYFIVFIFDLMIMGVVDFSYVYIVINYGTTVVTLTAFSLAVFRVLTNNLLLWKAIPGSISMLTYLIPAWKEYYFYQRKYPGNIKNVLNYYTYRDISFMENLILFNNIIIPVLAIVFILPDCFYNALFAAQDVTSYYSFKQCDQYILAVDVGRLCSEQTQYLSYSPPYIYSYQCSSKVIINYVSVYILMFILVGFIPLMKLGIKLCYDSVVKSIKSTETPTRLQLRTKFYLEELVPNYYKQIREARDDETTVEDTAEETESEMRSERLESNASTTENHSMIYRLTMNFVSPILAVTTGVLAGARGETPNKKKKKEKPQTFLLFSKLRLTVQINSYLTILATFGALFPPLAIIACMTIFIITYFEELSIGWLLAETRARKYFWYEEQLNHEAENVEKSSNFTLWSTLTVSCFFYGYIVFDTMGDTSGWKAALPMTILLFTFPLLLYIFITYFNKCRDPSYWRNPAKCFVDCADICRSKNQNDPSTAVAPPHTQSRLSNMVGDHPTAARRSSQIELNHRPSKDKDNEVMTMTNPIHEKDIEVSLPPEETDPIEQLP
jgi:Leucine-rich repeat (LRR) protein